jgi:hypothetical protein
MTVTYYFEHHKVGIYKLARFSYYILTFNSCSIILSTLFFLPHQVRKQRRHQKSKLLTLRNMVLNQSFF